MKTTEARDSNKVGGSIDSWCAKCQLVLAHTIEAIVKEKPTRVHCNTCKAKHSYRAQQPAARSAEPEAAPVKRKTSRYRSLLKGRDASSAPVYSTTERYSAGDVMQHATFGFGVATAVKDGTKIEVLFEAGPKVLVHDR